MRVNFVCFSCPLIIMRRQQGKTVERNGNFLSLKDNLCRAFNSLCHYVLRLEIIAAQSRIYSPLFVSLSLIVRFRQTPTQVSAWMWRHVNAVEAYLGKPAFQVCLQTPEVHLNARHHVTQNLVMSHVRNPGQRRNLTFIITFYSELAIKIVMDTSHINKSPIVQVYVIFIYIFYRITEMLQVYYVSFKNAVCWSCLILLKKGLCCLVFITSLPKMLH